MNDVEAHLHALAASASPERASEIATAALRMGLRHPAFHVARARWFELANNHAEALNEFRQAFVLVPRDANLLDAIGLTLLRLNRFAQAIAAFDAAIRIAPAQAETHYHKACAHSAAGDPEAALRAHSRAIALQPDHADALAALAAAAARGGETAKATLFAERALKAAPAHPTAAISLVMCDLHDRDFARAEKRLEALLRDYPQEDQTRALALGLLGDALDGQERTDAALQAYTAKNKIIQNLYGEQFEGEFRLSNRIERIASVLKKMAPMPAPPAAREPSHETRHVFLLGFMRSGTTLLEQVLAAYPGVETLEERETFAPLTAAYLGTASGMTDLFHLKGGELDQARETYWQRVRAFGAKPDGKIFLDKQPFNTLNLPLIARLFPSARIIFLVRDPRDVLLSCFRRHLDVKPTTFELLTLAGGAQFYDGVMRFAELCRERLPLDVLECRYEDMVSDFENTLNRICRFLDIEFTEAMRNFDENARSRTIRSASSNQVRRGLYAEGIGQWRRYENQLSPVFPVLQPWIARFGYV